MSRVCETNLDANGYSLELYTGIYLFLRFLGRDGKAVLAEVAIALCGVVGWKDCQQIDQRW